VVEIASLLKFIIYMKSGAPGAALVLLCYVLQLVYTRLATEEAYLCSRFLLYPNRLNQLGMMSVWVIDDRRTEVQKVKEK